MSSTKIKAPLVINIFWHNADKEMHKLGNLCYNFFLRNEDNPLDRHLGIQTHMYPYIPDISSLNLEDAHFSANILLVDDHMKLSEDWLKFAESLYNRISALDKGNHQLFPVANHSDALEFSEKLSDINYIRLYNKQEAHKQTFFLINISRSICRLLFRQKPLEEDVKLPNPPIKLFLSHAKNDGSVIAEKLRDHINNLPSIETFFDAHNIADGYNFEEQIVKHVKESILVVIHTDEYSSREWCRKEVIIAKKNSIPVIVVNQFSKGELRSFPYIGNVPHVNIIENCEDDTVQESFDIIVLEAMREALRLKYNALKMKELTSVFKVEVKTKLNYPPELLTLTQIKDNENELILYPDPPLGQEEIDLLKEFREDLDFITPTLLPLWSEEISVFDQIKNKKIAISLSEINVSEFAWIQNRGIQDLMVEITKYLLVGGAKLIYSGNLFHKSEASGFNFSELLIKLVKTYKTEFQDSKIEPIINYSAYPYFHALDIRKKADLRNLVKFIPVSPPDYLNVDASHVEYIESSDSFEKNYVLAKSLSQMRTEMLSSADVLIVLGGKSKGFSGKMPGILEETLLALRFKKPVFLIGSFGGVAGGIVEALRGNKPERFDVSFFESYYPSYTSFICEYNNHNLTNEDEKVDYNEIVKILKKTGKSSADFGLNNGLSKKDNKRLFNSKNELEILSLILKGLTKISTS